MTSDEREVGWEERWIRRLDVDEGSGGPM